MRINGENYFVGLDVGTSSVKCVIGTHSGDDTTAPSIIGHGSAPNFGMRRGVVIHPEDTAQAIIAAVSEAERLSGVSIKTATVNINGSHVSGNDSNGVIAISAANREITSDDRLRVEEAATIVQLPPNREIIQVFAKNYRVDGQDNIKDPIGMRGVRLEVDTHIVTASTPHNRSLDIALEQAGILPGHRTVGSLAAAEVVLNRQQKESGTLLLDIGAGTTNLVVIEDGEVQHVAVIPMGGVHITNDLAIGLKTDLEVAEQVKIKYAGLGSHAPKSKIEISENDEKHEFHDSDVKLVVEARVDEIFDYVERELKKIHKSRKLPGGVVMVGGTSKIPGLEEFARNKLELSAKVGKLQPIGGMIDAIQDPSFDTSIGLMVLDMLLSKHHSPGDIGLPDQGLLGMITGLIGKIKLKRN